MEAGNEDKRNRGMSDNKIIIVSRTEDGYLARPLGVKGAAVGQGNTPEEAAADAESAVKAHAKEFGEEHE